LNSATKHLVEFKADSEIIFGSLDDIDHNWDQFELNKQKFNVETTYHENHYTTELDYNAIPLQVKHKAEKIAHVIIINSGNTQKY
jgi:PAB1-binding protein PBP1